MRKLFGFWTLSFVLLSAVAVQAQTTKGEISFSGTATGQGSFGTADLTFRLWTAATGGTFVNYSDSQAGVPVNPDDSFSAILGAGTGGDVPPSVFAANPSMFIAVELTSAPGAEIGPRVPLFSSAYAANAASLGKPGAASIVRGSVNLESSSASSGNILKDGLPFIHNFGTDNTFIGSSAGNLTMSGASNTAAGARALQINTTGAANTAVGTQAMLYNSQGLNNTAIGVNALRGIDTYWVGGSSNTAVGANALQFNYGFLDQIGAFNTAIGESALNGNTGGRYNTAAGAFALQHNASGNFNTAVGRHALGSSQNASLNTAVGERALLANVYGTNNTALGVFADVSANNLTNATAIGAGAVVNASNKIRLGNADVRVIEGQVGFTASSDRNKKENFKPVEGEEVLSKIRGLSLTSWNFIGHDPKQFRHYGPMAQDFFAAFGHDGIGTIGTETTITSTDIDGILMVAAQALEKRTVEQRKEIDALTVRLANETHGLRQESDALRAENADLKERLEALERTVGDSR